MLQTRRRAGPRHRPGSLGREPKADDTFAARARGLAADLRELEIDEIRAFDAAVAAQRERADTAALSDAAFAPGGGCGDDGFTDFRSWLISMGREAFERALRDPDSLGSVAFGPGLEEDCFFEEYAYVATRVYEEKTGQRGGIADGP